jgi:hypothetical protein
MLTNYLSFNTAATAGSNQTYYVNSDFSQDLLLNLSFLRHSIPNSTLDINKVDLSDFELSGLSYVRANETDSAGYNLARFSPIGFDEDWVGSISLADDQDFIVSSTNPPYDFPLMTINLVADTVDPFVESIVEVFSAPNGFTPIYPTNGDHYFLVTFSEQVKNGDSITFYSSNFYASPGYSVDSIFTPTMSGSGSTTNGHEQLLVRVASTGQGSTNPELGIPERLEVSNIDFLTSPPSNVEIYNNSGSSAGGGHWYRMELSHEVSKNSFLMTNMGGAPEAQLSFWSGAFTLTNSTSGSAAPSITGIAFQNNRNYVDEFFFKTDAPLNLDNISVNFNTATNHFQDKAGNFLGEPDLDDTVLINDSTPAWDGTAASYINPPTLNGFDTLKIVLRNGAVTVNSEDEVADYIPTTSGPFETFNFNGSKFDRYEIDAAKVHFDGMGGTSDVVALYRVGGNTLNLGSGEITEIETDIVDYSNLQDGIQITLGLGSQATTTNAASAVAVTFSSATVGAVNDLTKSGTGNAQVEISQGSTGVKEVAKVSFSDLSQGQEIGFGGLIFTAGTNGATASQIAAAFASKADGFSPTTTAVPGGQLTGTLTGWETRYSVVDTVRGAEGVKGGQGSNTITGNSQDNLLIGGNGTGKDELNGGAGNDILFGGSSLSTAKDILIGGAGRDVLIDLDGAVMTGHGASAGSPPAVASNTQPGPKDVFVVRTGSTITDYVLANNNAGLAGRAVGGINDIITFNIDLAALAVRVEAAGTDTLDSVIDEIYDNFTFSVASTVANQWDITVSSTYEAEISPGVFQTIMLNNLADVKVAASVQGGDTLTVVELDNQNYFDNTRIGDIFSPNIDPSVLDSLLPDIGDSMNGEGTFNLSFALEATRDGTVRAPRDGNLMFGDFAKELRIFNPGNKSEVIFGSRKDDAYEFLVQDFSVGGSQNSFFVGNDIIRDSGGNDNVVFSGVSLATIDTLEFEAVKIGREKGNYSLKTNYDQSEMGIDNHGSFTWTGHFREGVDMQLETITLGAGETKRELFLADNTYEYSSSGYLLSATPIQEAVEGRDTIMVGGSGRDGDHNRFKLIKNTSSSSTEQTDLYIWGIDSDDPSMGTTDGIVDLIDLSAFIDEDDFNSAQVQQIGSGSKYMVNLFDSSDPDNLIPDTNFELTIHFMGSNVSQTTLEQMIMNAYTTST